MFGFITTFLFSQNNWHHRDNGTNGIMSSDGESSPSTSIKTRMAENQETNKMELIDLNEDCSTYVFRHLSLLELNTVGLTCKNFHHLKYSAWQFLEMSIMFTISMMRLVNIIRNWNLNWKKFSHIEINYAVRKYSFPQLPFTYLGGTKRIFNFI